MPDPINKDCPKCGKNMLDMGPWFMKPKRRVHRWHCKDCDHYHTEELGPMTEQQVRRSPEYA